ncbi:MAG: hypothetical protein HY830_25295 [Actinobacteria bacterium]|nr:hypothetical protein [Actinomycetota bacterium]
MSTLIFVTFVLTAVAGTVLAIARPWELRGGRFVDKIRVGEAVSSYDFWLGLRGVSGRRRRELRAELRANLWEATQRVGAKEAIAAVGPLRQLAFDSVSEHRGPRWGYGVAAGFVALQVFLTGQVLLTSVVVDTAQAARASRLDVAVTIVPGMTVHYEDTVAGGFSFGTDFGPACLVVGLVVFVLVAQPWRLLHRRSAVPA